MGSTHHRQAPHILVTKAAQKRPVECQGGEVTSCTFMLVLLKLYRCFHHGLKMSRLLFRKLNFAAGVITINVNGS